MPQTLQSESLLSLAEVSPFDRRSVDSASVRQPSLEHCSLCAIDRRSSSFIWTNTKKLRCCASKVSWQSYDMGKLTPVDEGHDFLGETMSFMGRKVTARSETAIAGQI